MHEQLYTVGEVAQMFELTVRTLHHWDNIGLVTPRQRDWQDFRLYDDADLARIHDVLTYRAVGLPLRDIRSILDASEPSLVNRLLHQKQVLLHKQGQLSGMLDALDELLEEAMSDDKVSLTRRAEILGAFYRPELETEAAEKWGDTKEWAQSQQVSQSMSEQDWQELSEIIETHQQELADAMHRGVKPGSAEANALAERNRNHLSRWFPMSVSQQVIIARGYVADPRYKDQYEAVAPGLSQWLFDIIAANALAQGIDPDSAQWS